MATTVTRIPASFRFQSTLLDELKERAKASNRSLNNYVESLLLNVLLFSAKFCLKKFICLKMKYIQFPKRAFWDTPFRCEG